MPDFAHDLCIVFSGLICSQIFFQPVSNCILDFSMSALAIHQPGSSTHSPATSHFHFQAAQGHVSLHADRLMLLLICISAMLAFPIGWHYTNLDIVSWAAPVLVLMAAALYACFAGSSITRYALPLILCATVVLHIQVSMGMLEFHFGVFVTLALVMVYRQWRVVAVCAVFLRCTMCFLTGYRPGVMVFTAPARLISKKYCCTRFLWWHRRLLRYSFS